MEHTIKHEFSDWEVDSHGDVVRMCVDCGVEQFCQHNTIDHDEEGAYCLDCGIGVSSTPADLSGATGDDR